MAGIVEIDFNNLIKNNDLKLDTLKTNISNLKRTGYELGRTVGTSELSFLTEKFINEVGLCSNILLKTKAYQKSLNSVYNGYIKQAEITRDTANRLAS